MGNLAAHVHFMKKYLSRDSKYIQKLSEIDDLIGWLAESLDNDGKAFCLYYSHNSHHCHDFRFYKLGNAAQKVCLVRC